MVQKILISILLISYFTLAKAAWPIITVPSTEEVLSLVSQSDCPFGSVQISPGRQISIASPYLPKNEEWSWEFSGDTTCHKLPVNIYDFHYVYYQQCDPSHITIGYGLSSDKILFTFNLKIKSEHEVNSWDCGPLISNNPPTKIGCARDT